VPTSASHGIRLVIGEREWSDTGSVLCIAFDEFDKRGLRLTPELHLEVHDEVGNWLPVTCVLWRGQFDEHFSAQHASLNLIHASGVPCLNSTQTIRLASSRVSLAAEFKKSGLPIISAYHFLGSGGIGYFHNPQLPCVVKIGNWHMGYGKIKASTPEVWSDAADLSFITKESIAVEPFLTYRRDIRILVLGEKLLAFERVPSQWRANVCPLEGKIIEVPNELVNMSKRAAATIGANILGVDWVQIETGEWVILEANIAPGLQFGDVDLRPELLKMLSKT
jgi:ribosomal protein S6--L-glutamate ligase